ncbi:MAG: hypothetical protein K0R02_21 [Rickettsiaceae bacterium]|jgi:hypothetical protein|nr:hypothetical protein [Rickettsiaceae bacterium]
MRNLITLIFVSLLNLTAISIFANEHEKPAQEAQAPTECHGSECPKPHEEHPAH